MPSSSPIHNIPDSLLVGVPGDSAIWATWVLFLREFAGFPL